MKVTFTEPPSSGNQPDSTATLKALRRAFHFMLQSGRQAIHRHALTRLVDLSLQERGFNPLGGRRQWMPDSRAFNAAEYLDELLGSARSSTFSLRRAGLLIKAGSWLCPRKPRFVSLFGTESSSCYLALAPLPAEGIRKSNPEISWQSFADAGVVLIGRCSGDGPQPSPVVNPESAIGLPASASRNDDTSQEFLSRNLLPVTRGEHSPYAKTTMRLSSGSWSYYDDRWQIWSFSKQNAPSDLFSRDFGWGSMLLRDGFHVFPALQRSASDEPFDANHARPCLLLFHEEELKDLTRPPKGWSMTLTPFLRSQIHWALSAARDDSVSVVVSSIDENWVAVDINGSQEFGFEGPLRTWLALVGKPVTGQRNRWEIRREAVPATKKILRQYFARVDDKTVAIA